MISKNKKLYIETDLQGMCGPNFSSFGSAQLPKVLEEEEEEGEGEEEEGEEADPNWKLYYQL